MGAASRRRKLSGTPKSLQRKMFLGLVLRAGGGARYQLAVFPLQQKAQLREYLADGSVKFVKQTIAMPTYWALGTRAFGEVLSADSY